MYPASRDSPREAFEHRVPTICRSSPGVFTRCEPVPLMITKSFGGTCRSSSSSHGSSRSVGSGRVMSGSRSRPDRPPTRLGQWPGTQSGRARPPGMPPARRPGLDEARLQNRDIAGQVDVEPVVAVLQVDAHLQILRQPVLTNQFDWVTDYGFFTGSRRPGRFSSSRRQRRGRIAWRRHRAARGFVRRWQTASGGERRPRPPPLNPSISRSPSSSASALP